MTIYTLFHIQNNGVRFYVIQSINVIIYPFFTFDDYVKLLPLVLNEVLFHVKLLFEGQRFDSFFQNFVFVAEPVIDASLILAHNFPISVLLLFLKVFPSVTMPMWKNIVLINAEVIRPLNGHHVLI